MSGDLLTNILKLLAGIGLFMFAMYLLEKSLKTLTGRKFKLFLQRMTRTHVGGVAGGAIITALLQSSSMVTVMVLAFVGASVITMVDAMAIILGANLGTTATGWLVAILGFKMDLGLVAYPALCIGGILLLLFKERSKSKYLAYFLFGFGLLFIGLSFMKTAMEEEVNGLDLSQFEGMSLFIYLLLGFVATILVQSSSVTTALSLSALSAGAIAFAPAVAMVIGAELGTNVKLVLSGIGGNASKKRVILGTILFNLVLTVLAFAFLKPILHLITEVVGISDPLIGLALFSTLVNLCGILIALPILKLFVKLLERFFNDAESAAAVFLPHANVDEPEVALDMFRREAEFFIHDCMLFVLAHFEVNVQSKDAASPFHEHNEKKRFLSKDQDARYDYLKQLQGEIQAFYLLLRAKLMEADSQSAGQLNQYISAVRSGMYASKCIRDIRNNIENVQQSSKDVKYQFYRRHQQETVDFYKELDGLLEDSKHADFDALHRVYRSIEDKYSAALDNFYREAAGAPIETLDMTTVLNFNRELFTSNKAMFMAVKDLLLDEKQAEKFSEIPVYRT
jgi:phosphate:Na+ symporter